MRKVKDDQEKAQQEHEEIKAEVDSKEKKFEKFKKWVQSVNVLLTLDIPTIHSNYRQVVLSSTLDFLLVFTLDGLPELGSSFKEIFFVAPFEKNSKIAPPLTIMAVKFLHQSAWWVFYLKVSAI